MISYDPIILSKLLTGWLTLFASTCILLMSNSFSSCLRLSSWHVAIREKYFHAYGGLLTRQSLRAACTCQLALQPPCKTSPQNACHLFEVGVVVVFNGAFNALFNGARHLCNSNWLARVSKGRTYIKPEALQACQVLSRFEVALIKN